MIKLNRKVEYAFVALKHMSLKRPGELTSAKEVADSYHCPFDATARVMQIMAQKGFLHVELGAQGGYLIKKDLARMTVFDLYTSILGSVPLSKCLSNDESCEMKSGCNIITPVHILSGRMAEFFKSMTIHEILEAQP
jgi:Rrf2 family protein